MSPESFVHEVIRASAGTGKTHQLTNRYLSLLVSGVGPDAILATTFTRKAAGEILNRVLSRLAKAANDDKGARELAREIGAKKTTRQQFASCLAGVLRNLHHVRIGTLDSFFIALAGTFALELGLSAGWSICEEEDDARLKQEALERVLESEDETTLSALYQRLTYGHTKRAVQAELRTIVKDLYGIHQETKAEAWSALVVAPALAPEKLEDLLEQIEAFDLSKQSGMQKPRAEDVDRARSAEWKDLLKTGLCGKVLSGENAFRSKPIPEGLIALYRRVLEHVRSLLVGAVAVQTEATRQFLEHFDRELRKLKETSGALRFQEVTQALAGQTIEGAGLGYRLGCAVDHLLLDEFQDTALAQWHVLKPMALAIVDPKGPRPRSFSCVGDMKQAIYGWRGGMTRIFSTLDSSLGPLQARNLDDSQRSAQPIIDVVNMVFGNVEALEAKRCKGGLAAWSQRFPIHRTVKKVDPGFVCMHTGPAQREGEGVCETRGRHCEYVADRIQELAQQMPERPIGVLCRTNDMVARMIFELRRRKVDASEEGGNPLTDSAAVELILSLLTLADHPAHTIAWFHLQNSPLKEHLGAFAGAEALARHIRCELLSRGYGAFVFDWAKLLVCACDRRELARLQQLIDVAYGFEKRSTLRADDFVAWIRQQKIPDPSDARVRVMTIHAAKGLGFDVVVLPELDATLTGRSPAFVVRRDPRTLDVDFVCRYADGHVRKLLTADEQIAFEQDLQQRVEESLSLLYVAMTRAASALHMYIPGPRRKGRSDPEDGWYKLLQTTLAPGTPWSEKFVLYKHGDPKWHCGVVAEESVSRVERPPPSIVFRASTAEERRGLEQIAPSRHAGRASLNLDRLFNRAEEKGTAIGTLFHLWFATIAWLDEGIPAEADLRAAAQKARLLLPAELFRDLDRFIAQFHSHCQDPEIGAVLRRRGYAGPRERGFPASFTKFWTKGLTPQQVECERRFLVREGNTILNGSLDRVIWIGDGVRVQAADVIDFKTDTIIPGDEAALSRRIEEHRPQLESYRRAVARLADLPAQRVAARLVFTSIARVVEL